VLIGIFLYRGLCLVGAVAFLVTNDFSDWTGVIVRQGNGLYLGAADPRSDGVVAAY